MADDFPERHVFDYGDFGPALSLPERLALRVPAPCVCVETPLCNQHKAIVAAIRAALDEAVKVARAIEDDNTIEPDGTIEPPAWYHGFSEGAGAVAAAIEALKG